MTAIEKVSEITYQDIADYLRIVELTADDIELLKTLIDVAINFCADYTGQTEEGLDDFEDMVIVVFVLVQDMYDNRTLYVDKTNLNRVVESILGMHSVNLL